MSELAERVTIVLLTYRCAHRLAPVLDHLLPIGVPVVAVDNGSDDGTVRLLRERGVRTVALPRNVGAAARNIGVQLAGTPYVACCDDDGWWDRASLQRAADLLDAHPRLAVVNARILVGAEQRLDPICAEMEQSPLRAADGAPGTVLLGFMAGAVVIRVAAYRRVGGYHPRYFIGGEEQTLAAALALDGWAMRYVEDVVAHHEPSIANAPSLRWYGLRNTLWTYWQHRRLASGLRATAQELAAAPKNRNWLRGTWAAVRGLPEVLRQRRVMSRELDRMHAVLDRRRYADRAPFWSRYDPLLDPRRTEQEGTTAPR